MTDEERLELTQAKITDLEARLSFAQARLLHAKAIFESITASVENPLDDKSFAAEGHAMAAGYAQGWLSYYKLCEDTFLRNRSPIPYAVEP